MLVEGLGVGDRHIEAAGEMAAHLDKHARIATFTQRHLEAGIVLTLLASNNHHAIFAREGIRYVDGHEAVRKHCRRRPLGITLQSHFFAAPLACGAGAVAVPSMT